MAYPHKSQKIAETIASWLEEKRYKPGDRFPSDQELAREFGVNHLTVRTALRRFVEAGVLERRVGAGTIVRDPRTASGVTPAVVLGVALAVPDATHSFFSELLRGAEAALLTSGRPLLFGHTWELSQREEQVVDAWMAQGVRHMILTPPALDVRFYQSLLMRGARLVFVDRRVPGVDVPSVVSRDEIGMRLLVQHLVERGHRRLVHLAGPENIWTAQQRRRSFEETAREAGLDVGPNLRVVPSGYYLEDGYRATQVLIAAGPLPEVIVAANDPVAVGAVRALQEKGIRVPQDTLVTGYGDTDLGRNFNLTTIRQFPEQMGSDAVRLLLGTEPIGARDSIELTPELVVRG